MRWRDSASIGDSVPMPHAGDGQRNCDTLQGLRLDTGGLVLGSGGSALASNVEHGSSLEHSDSIEIPSHGTEEPEADRPSMISDSDLAASWCAGDDAEQQALQHEKAATDSAQSSFRKRGTSISFDSHAVLDDGARHSMNEPLPRTGSSRRGTRGQLGDATADDTAQFDPTMAKTNPFTGEPIKPRKRVSDMVRRLPRLESQGDADGTENIGQQASMTSNSTVSPERDEAKTPNSPRSYFSTPMVASPALSPLLGSESWSLSRQGSAKSNRTSRLGSMRNASRRSSRRSTSVSNSPASAFLARWGQDSISSIVPEPDDEGQSFGLENEYVIGQQVGFGGFSVVKEAYTIADTKGTGKCKRAVKIVRKVLGDKAAPEHDKYQQQLEHEVGMWRYLSHGNILSLHSVFDTDFATFCVMDLIKGGALFDVVRQARRSGQKGLTSSVAKSYTFQLASALRYLHEDVRIVHRDVKLENCLIDRSNVGGEEPDAGHLLLCDFGLSDFISNERHDDTDASEAASDSSTRYVVGSVEYAAPEIFEADGPLLNPAVDMWAFGNCVFALVTGDLPFRHSLRTKIVEKVRSGVWDEQAVRDSLAGAVDCEDIIELLRGCLDVDPQSRWRVANVLQCKWLVGCGEPYDDNTGWNNSGP